MDILKSIEMCNMQNILDNIYKRSLKKEIFTNLMPLIQNENNILLAYTILKSNPSSYTSGIDGLTIKDIDKISYNDVIFKLKTFLNKSRSYLPKPSKIIVSKNLFGNEYSYAISCIWDRLIQQCIKQVLDPIFEAKFSDNSFAYRPDRSYEFAIARFNQIVNLSHNFFIIEINFDNLEYKICHKKLMRQLWSLGIRDRRLLWIIGRMLKSQIINGNEIVYPKHGTLQCGLLSHIFLNVALNELDQHIDDMWCNNPLTEKFYTKVNSSGKLCKSTAFKCMKNTNLKEARIIRFGNICRILCPSYNDAYRVKMNLLHWIPQRLQLNISDDEIKIIDIRRTFINFLGFKLKAVVKGKINDNIKYVINSRMSDNAFGYIKNSIKQQIRNIRTPRVGYTENDEVNIYNSLVLSIHKYFQIATHISVDCEKLNWIAKKSLQCIKTKLKKHGNQLSDKEKRLFGKSTQLRYLSSSGIPIYPIGIINCRKPLQPKGLICNYTETGRALKTKDNINKDLIQYLQECKQFNRSIEYKYNKFLLFEKQLGKCAISGLTFINGFDIHCHHIIPKSKNGLDSIDNLIIVNNKVHKLIHATTLKTIQKYLNQLCLTNKQLKDLNELRLQVGNNKI